MFPPEFLDLLDDMEALAGKLSRINREDAQAALGFLSDLEAEYRGEAARPNNVIELESRRR